MQFTILTLSLAALAACNPVERRMSTVSSVTGVISNVDSLTGSLGTVHAQIHSGMTSAAVPAILSYSNTCALVASNVTAALTNSNTFNQADSAKLGAALISGLQPTVTTFVNNLVAQQNAFEAAQANGQPAVILKYLSADVVAIASAVIDKVSGPTAVAEAEAALQTLETLLKSAKSQLKN
jgi:hypothetical protein